MLCRISLAGVLSKCAPPDTIPNSEVKALRPDDSLLGESRVRRHMKSFAENKSPVIMAGLLFLAYNYENEQGC